MAFVVEFFQLETKAIDVFICGQRKFQPESACDRVRIDTVRGEHDIARRKGKVFAEAGGNDFFRRPERQFPDGHRQAPSFFVCEWCGWTV